MVRNVVHLFVTLYLIRNVKLIFPSPLSIIILDCSMINATLIKYTYTLARTHAQTQRERERERERERGRDLVQ